MTASTSEPRVRGPVEDTMVHLGKPPTVPTFADDGHAQAAAEQAAERGVRGGSLDAPGVEAAIDLPFERLREAEADAEEAAAGIESLISETAGDFLDRSARRGVLVEASEHTLTDSAVGLAAEGQDAEAELADAVERRRDLVAMLHGEKRAPDGSDRSDLPLAAAATDAESVGRALRRERWMNAAWAVLPLIEAIPVAYNMHAYLRLPDSDWALPITISAIALSVLTLSPLLLGRAINDLVHGARANVAGLASLAVLATVWVTVGVSLAVVRVAVDRETALREAAEDARRASGIADGLGGVTSADQPSAAFDPVVPTVFWIAVFLGFGVVAIVWETWHRNPVRLQELAARLAVLRLREQRIRVVDHRSAVDDSVEAQQAANLRTVTMWEAMDQLIAARARRDIAVHHQALGEVSGDPAMPLAVERHRATRAERAWLRVAGDAPATGGKAD